MAIKVNDIGATAVITLWEFQEKLQDENIEMRFVRIKTHVMEIMMHGGLEEAIPPPHFYLSIQAGVNACLAELQARQREK